MRTDQEPSTKDRVRTLVTGAAGFAGSHLVELLGRDGVEIVGWHRPGGTPPLALPNVRWEAVDLLDAAAVTAAIGRLRPAIVYQCAGEAHVGDSWQQTEATFAANVRGTHRVLDALRRHRVASRVIVPSSAMVYRPSEGPLDEEHPLAPRSPYGVSKLAQELLARRSTEDGVAVTIARPFNHIGPRQSPSFAASSFARQIAEIEAGRRGPEIVVGNLTTRRDLTDVRDTVRAYRLILERGVPGRPYNVCSGHAVPIRELLDLLIARARVTVTVRVDSSRYQPNDLPVIAGDPSRIRDELGWQPEIPLMRTADDLLHYWREHIGL